MNYNLVVLDGHVTRDIQLSYTPNQVSVASFGIAVNKKYKDKETVLFIDLVAFGKQADNLNKYVKCGDLLFISGKLKIDLWTDTDGKTRSKYAVIVHSFQFLSKAEPKPVDEKPENNNVPF